MQCATVNGFAKQNACLQQTGGPCWGRQRRFPRGGLQTACFPAQSNSMPAMEAKALAEFLGKPLLHGAAVSSLFNLRILGAERKQKAPQALAARGVKASGAKIPGQSPPFLMPHRLSAGRGLRLINVL